MKFGTNTRFHAGSNPSARSFQGTATGLSVLGVQPSGDDVVFGLTTLFASMPDASVELEATVQQSVQLVGAPGPGPIVWMNVGGSLPAGVTLQADGLLTGASEDVGTFSTTVDATNGLGLTAVAMLTVHVGRPSIPLAQLASPFLLGGPPLGGVQAAFLDRQGNGDGSYDLGDFRAWVLANPSLPLSAALAPANGITEPPGPTLPTLLFEPEGGAR